MRRRISISEDESDPINLTPLLDVLFLILVFFILIAPLLDFDRLQLAASSENKEELSPLKDSALIKIYVQKDNTIYLGTHPISLIDLRIVLHDMHVKSPQTTPQLYPDREASFGTYQQIKNLVESVGFEQLDVVLKHE